MDTHVNKDPLNPINHEPKTNYCNICDIEESKTYFVDDSGICEDCYYSCCGDELNQDVRICPTCLEHN